MTTKTLTEVELFADADEPPSDMANLQIQDPESTSSLSQEEYYDEEDYYEEDYDRDYAIQNCGTHSNQQQQSNKISNFQPSDNLFKKYSNKINVEKYEGSSLPHHAVSHLILNEKKMANERRRTKDKHDRATAEQFESAYKPKALRNWEVPKTFPASPRRRVGETRVIANERGHILPDIKKTKQQPWGEFVGTWNLPKTFNKETALRVNKSDKDQRFGALKQERENEDTRHASNTDEQQVQHVPYVPGDLTEEKHRPESHRDILARNRFNDKPPEAHPAYPKYRDDFSRKSPDPPEPLDRRVDEVLKNCRAKETTMVSADQLKRRKNGILSPIRTAISNFVTAKKLHKENLEHDPLPDTITDSIYRKLQLQRNVDEEPGLALPEENYACGIGWKGHPGYGPTKCTKMKIYRPKTCALHPKKEAGNEGRPGSAASFERKWRFVRQNKVNPIDLAICWDLCPENEEDEPKPPAHIDGSNGSRAPAVFSMVHTPEDENGRSPKCDGGPVFDRAPKINEAKEFLLDRPRTSSSKSSSDKRGDKKRSKSAHGKNSTTARPSLGSKSTPDLSEDKIPTCKQHSCKKLGGKRLCVACELKKLPDGERRPRKTEYKMAFKAGVPQKLFDNREKREDYPDHWRLATVYQHSYKPLHLRKRSLLHTVYK